jgi:hypothetical protein
MPSGSLSCDASKKGAVSEVEFHRGLLRMKT